MPRIGRLKLGTCIVGMGDCVVGTLVAGISRVRGISKPDLGSALGDIVLGGDPGMGMPLLSP